MERWWFVREGIDFALIDRDAAPARNSELSDICVKACNMFDRWQNGIYSR